jgi:hypothetical protein
MLLAGIAGVLSLLVVLGLSGPALAADVQGGLIFRDPSVSVGLSCGDPTCSAGATMTLDGVPGSNYRLFGFPSDPTQLPGWPTPTSTTLNGAMSWRTGNVPGGPSVVLTGPALGSARYLLGINWLTVTPLAVWDLALPAAQEPLPPAGPTTAAPTTSAPTTAAPTDPPGGSTPTTEAPAPTTAPPTDSAPGTTAPPTDSTPPGTSAPTSTPSDPATPTDGTGAGSPATGSATNCTKEAPCFVKVVDGVPVTLDGSSIQVSGLTDDQWAQIQLGLGSLVFFVSLGTVQSWRHGRGGG